MLSALSTQNSVRFVKLHLFVFVAGQRFNDSQTRRLPTSHSTFSLPPILTLNRNTTQSSNLPPAPTLDEHIAEELPHENLADYVSDTSIDIETRVRQCLRPFFEKGGKCECLFKSLTLITLADHSDAGLNALLLLMQCMLSEMR